jgi:hypothetical protein
MSRFSDQVGTDLHEIADRATPSSDAWESIRTRIEAAGDKPEMEIIMLTPDSQKETRRLPVLVGAAVTVVILAIAAVVVFGGDEDTTDAANGGERADPLSVALEFMAARDSWDGTAVRALLADDAVIDGFADNADGYLQQSSFEQATGWRYMEPQCTEVETGPPGSIICTYTMQNAWSQALGVGPFGGSNFEFVIEEGRIQEMTHTFQFDAFSESVWEVFLRWTELNHPDDVNTMYDFSGLIEIPITTPEAVVLWEQYTSEFVAEQAGS